MEWIAIKDQLPEENKAVLLYDQDNYMAVAWLQNNSFVFECMFYGINDFTHWMPLPKPPSHELDTPNF